MFTVTKKVSERVEYQLRDNASDSYITILPELGALITEFNVKGEEIFYLDRDILNTPEPITAGGNPFMFPVTGRLTNGQYEVDGTKYTMPLHGFARTSSWEVKAIEEGDRGEVILELTENQETLKIYPFKFHVELKYVLEGGILHIYQKYTNNSEIDMPFYTGFHPYFSVGSKDRLEFDINTDGHMDYNEGCFKNYDGKIDFSKPVDFVFALNDVGGSSFGLKDPEKERRVQVETSDHFKYMVMWTLEGKDFLCIEPWMAAPNALNTGKGLYRLAPGETLNAWVKIEVMPL